VGTISAPGIVDQNFATVIFSYASTCSNIVITLYKIYIASKFLEEDFLVFCLLTLKARFGWIPYFHKIRDQKLNKKVDYSFIDCPLPIITKKLGIYNRIEFEFSELSIQSLI